MWNAINNLIKKKVCIKNVKSQNQEIKLIIESFEPKQSEFKNIV